MQALSVLYLLFFCSSGASVRSVFDGYSWLRRRGAVEISYVVLYVILFPWAVSDESHTSRGSFFYWMLDLSGLVAATQVIAGLRLDRREPGMDSARPPAPPLRMACSPRPPPARVTPAPSVSPAQRPPSSRSQPSLVAPPPPGAFLFAGAGPPPGTPVAPGAPLSSPPPQGPRLQDSSAARRYRTGRGGIDLGGARPMPAPKPTIIKINIYMDDGLGLGPADRWRMQPRVAFSSDKILQSTLPFCSQPWDKLRAAVSYLEARQPRLARCESSWGACAVLARSLRHRQPRKPRERRVIGGGGNAGDGDAGGGQGKGERGGRGEAGEGDGESAGDGVGSGGGGGGGGGGGAAATTASSGVTGDVSTQGTREQELAQQQLDFLASLRGRESMNTIDSTTKNEKHTDGKRHNWSLMAGSVSRTRVLGSASKTGC